MVEQRLSRLRSFPPARATACHERARPTARRRGSGLRRPRNATIAVYGTGWPSGVSRRLSAAESATFGSPVRSPLEKGPSEGPFDPPPAPAPSRIRFVLRLLLLVVVGGLAGAAAFLPTKRAALLEGATAALLGLGLGGLFTLGLERLVGM